jgi:hypothetical protein
MCCHLFWTIPQRTIELVDDNRILNGSHVEALEKDPPCIALPSLHS